MLLDKQAMAHSVHGPTPDTAVGRQLSHQPLDQQVHRTPAKRSRLARQIPKATATVDRPKQVTEFARIAFL